MPALEKGHEPNLKIMETLGAPHRRFVAVDAQLADFEEELWRTIEFQLLINTNWTYWFELDELDDQSLNGIDWAIDHGCREMAARYRGTPVDGILTEFKQILSMMLHVAMNVPWPTDPERYIERIIENIRNEVDCYALFRDEMIRLNHHAHLLQRNWRKAITDPSHLACRRRLNREFEEDMEHLRNR
jgi:hypothetical protein